MRREVVWQLAEWQRRQLSGDPWVQVARPRPDASFRLFCFPGAGCGASGFAPWVGALPATTEACLVQLPGREQRQHELPFTRMDDLVAALASVLDPYLDRPFGFFGHGAGALVAFYLARRLRRLGAPLPERLWVSACRAPQLPLRTAPLSLLRAEAFVAEVLRRGLVPPGMRETPEQLAVALPALAADLAVSDLAGYETEAPLPCPIDALGGMRDTTVAWWELQAWRVQTTDRFRLRLLPGDHWYLQENPEFLVQRVGAGL